MVATVLKAEGGDLRRVDAIARALVTGVEGTFRVAAGAPELIPPGSAAGDLTALAEALIAAAQTPVSAG